MCSHVIDTAIQNDALSSHAQMRHFPKLLRRWHGQRALLKDLTTSHRSVTIKISDNPANSYLIIACLGPRNMRGEFQFDNSHLEVRCDTEGMYCVYDTAHDFALQCESVEVKEHGVANSTHNKTLQDDAASPRT